VIYAYTGRIGLELGRIRLKKKLKVNEWAPQLASAEASLNRKPMDTLRGNAPKDVENAIESNDPEEKVIEFKQLEQQARNIVVNRKEDKKVNRVLASNKARRAPVEPEKGQKGMIASRNRPGEARFQGRVRNLLDNKVQFGRAIDRATGESFPAKLDGSRSSKFGADCRRGDQTRETSMESGAKSRYIPTLSGGSR
jgi:hypothetical protein